MPDSDEPVTLIVTTLGVILAAADAMVPLVTAEAGAVLLVTLSPAADDVELWCSRAYVPAPAPPPITAARTAVPTRAVRARRGRAGALPLGVSAAAAASVGKPAVGYWPYWLVGYWLDGFWPDGFCARVLAGRVLAGRVMKRRWRSRAAPLA